jgi:hypothetical protein
LTHPLKVHPESRMTNPQFHIPDRGCFPFFICIFTAILLSAPFPPRPCPAQESRVDVTFGRVVVESRGVDGEALSTYVHLYGPEGERVGGGNTGKEGEIFFNLREGTYRAVVYANNYLEVAGLRVVAGQETRVRTDWGKLTLSLNEPGKYAHFYDAKGGRVLVEAIGKAGRVSCYVTPGTYRIQVHSEPRKEFRDLVVHANRETVAGDAVNRAPKITDLTSDPPVVRAGQSATIWVEASDEDADPLTFSYTAHGGRIEGKGERVVYHAPQGKGPYRVTVRVSDPRGASDTFEYYLSGGELTVRARTVMDEPFNANVQIYNQLGVRVEGGNLGPGGTKTWHIREGRYRIEAFGDNRVEVSDVHVATDHRSTAEVTFGRLVIESRGVDGEPVPAYVDLFDSDDRRLGGGRTEREGASTFHLTEGTYRVLLCASNHMEITGIRVVAGQEARFRADWGKLTLRLREAGAYASIYDREGRKVLGEAVGRGGRLSCYVSPGEYRIEVLKEPRQVFRNQVVHANRETVAGDAVNHSPRIADLSSRPPLVKAGQSARLRVAAEDEDGDPLTYTYSAPLGRIEGQGEQVIYHAPQQKGTYCIAVSVSDPHGASETSHICVSGGDLSVHTVTGQEEPFSAYVHIYNPAGVRVEAGNTGPGGTKTWPLPEGIYRLQAFGDNMVEVPDVQVTTDQRSRVEVAFGRLVVESLGVDGEPVLAQVELFDLQGQKVGGGKTQMEGVTLFNLQEGTYRAVLNAANPMEIAGIRVVAGRETRLKADWGKLTLGFREPAGYASIYDTEGRKVLGQVLGRNERLSWYVSPGTYRVVVLTEPLKEFRDLAVYPNMETMVGEAMNRRPMITNISSDPPLVKAGETARIRVEAHDEDGDRLSYEYIPKVGRIEGNGEEVVYYAPQERGPYHFIIRVSDPHGESHAFDCFISGGDLTLRTLTADERPLDALVHIYNGLGVRVASGNVGEGGARTWRLPEGAYKLEVFGDNRIEVPEVNVVTDLDTVAMVNFGKLVVECFGVDKKPLNSYVVVKNELDEKVAAAATGEDGVIDFNLRPGLYDIFAFQANAVVRPRVRIDSQQEYVVSLNPSSEAAPMVHSNRPAIEQIVIKPVKGPAPREFEVAVILSEPLTEGVRYYYFCEGGTVTGSGPKVLVRGMGKRAILIRVNVIDSSGEGTAGEVSIPASKGDRP